MGIEARDRRARIGFGIANLAVGAFVVGGVFRCLPTRWWVVDTGAIVVGLLLGSSGVALLARARVAEALTRVASGVVLAIGLVLVAAIVTTAGWIGGVYGQVGASGAIIFGLVAALVVPYVVVLPAVELAWIGPRGEAGSAPREAGGNVEPEPASGDRAIDANSSAPSLQAAAAGGNGANENGKGSTKKGRR